MTPPAIEVEGLSLSINGKAILSGVSFQVESGSYMSIIGPNGAGKTTVLRCLNGVLEHDAGRISLMGEPLDGYSQRELAKVLSYVPQPDGRYLPYTVFEFALMGRYPYLSPFSSVGPENREAARAALETAGVEPFAERLIPTLSGGERQKVFIAAALAQGGQILLLDEPTTFLDYKHQVEVAELLQRLNRDQGITVVSVTHDVNSAVLHGGAIVGLKDGRVAFNGSSAELLESGGLEEIYETGFHYIQDSPTGAPLVVPKGFHS
ncbi:MAG: ABC transporter ATP-binding protein [Candidatus Hydrogenedentes bacterium]|jgi:iron complex transport system ATP-binding protein|nr:ABC transporter ATP-binding protein [Candidatus Hydrogenedentota bacterium]